MYRSSHRAFHSERACCCSIQFLVDSTAGGSAAASVVYGGVGTATFSGSDLEDSTQHPDTIDL